MTEKALSPPPRDGLLDNKGKTPTIWRKWFEILSSSVLKQTTYVSTLNPASVSANTTAEQTFTVNGITTDDIITVTKPTHTTGLGIGNARGSANNTLAITFINVTASPIDPPSEDYLIMATRK